MTNDQTAAAGWYPDPDDANKQRYWDGQAWVDNQPGLRPDPDNPGMVRFWDGQQWSSEPMPAAVAGLFESISQLPGQSSSWNYVSPAEADGTISYLDADQRLQKTRLRTGVTKIIGLIGALIGGGVILIINIINILRGETIDTTFSVLFLVIPLIAVGYALYQGSKYLRARNDSNKAFLCSVTEVQGLPDQSLCTISGVIGADQGLDAFGRNDCVYLSYWYKQKDDSHQAISNSNFFLQDGDQRIYIDKDQISDQLIGMPVLSSLSADAWASFVGDEISLTGTIITRPDGSRGFQGTVEIGFPVAAYQNGRITSAQEAASARPVGQGPMGPAVVNVTNGSLYPDT